ncbi:MAG: response regulator [Sedimentisphaerales bacterium]|nr:response regulator [Sedimentisphaerales bacterium]
MDPLRILVVDDEPGMRLGVERALRNFSFDQPEFQTQVAFNIDTAESGEQALEIIKTTTPDILLLDHKLPGISGLDVLENLSQGNQKILTVMITAYASLDTAVTAIKRGAHDFLAKPFTPAELKAVVRKAAETLVLSYEARRLAREKRQVRFQFISVLAHELKAPIGAVEGYLNIARDHGLGSNITDYDRVIERSLVRLEGMRKMILDLLDMTHIESGQKKRELINLDLVAQAKAALETFTAQAAQRGITIELHAPKTLQITADQGEIEIVFNNLISNAVKYNRDQGHVDITLTDQGENVTIAVADTGIGMTPEESARLFQDFVRIKNEKTKNTLGSGLGLSILKKLALMYQGNIQVTSIPDKGSTFTATLAKHAVYDPDQHQPDQAQDPKEAKT